MWGGAIGTEPNSSAAPPNTSPMGSRRNQWVEYVGEASREQLRAELTAMPGIADRPGAHDITVTPTKEFYAVPPGSDVVDPQAAVATRVAAVEKAIEDGYTGFRAVSDATAVARTPEQRDAFACFEFLIDQQMTVLPASALCAYDNSQLAEDAAGLVCLHPFVNKGSVMFQLYAEPDEDMAFALTGEVDAASHELFTTTLQRIWPMPPGHTVRIDAQGLEFISHQQLLLLEEQARAHNSNIVLRTNQPIPTRLVDVLDLTDVQVEAVPHRAPADDAVHLREKPQHRERQLDSQPAIEQVKGMLIQNLGLDAHDAFDLLVSISQETNTKLGDVAERIRDELTGNAPHEARQATLDALIAVRDRLRRENRSQGEESPPPSPAQT
jgi:anti-anti-sigma regulatory factor